MTGEKLGGYEQLLKIDKENPLRIDHGIMSMLSDLARRGENVDEISISLIARINTDDLDAISEHATVYSNIGGIIVLAATPAQLLELMNMREVISLEASKPFYPDGN